MFLQAVGYSDVRKGSLIAQSLNSVNHVDFYRKDLIRHYRKTTLNPPLVVKPSKAKAKSDRYFT